MVGIFSRFASPKTAHHHQHSRNSSSSSEEPKVALPTGKESPSVPESAHGAVEEFMPVDHPTEPSDNDQPVRCPPLEPCIVHDGRIWKERLQLSVKQKGDLPFMRDNGASMQDLPIRRPASSSEQLILPSMSAPEKAFQKILD